MSEQQDEAFLERAADALAALPSVQAVALGGSRAQGTARPDSDWDLAVYYRGGFDPDDLRAVGWPGDVTEIGGWGGGVFNGGGWLEIEGRRVDVHYRDLDVVDRVLAEAERGEFRVEALLFHLAGIPTYLLAAELAGNRTLRGTLPRLAYPEALRRAAAASWAGSARLTLDYAAASAVPAGRAAQVAGAIGVAACQAGHAVLAARGEWVTNEKRLLDRAGLRELDGVVADLGSEPEALATAVRAAQALIERALAAEEATRRPS
jgi:predicted nucleotidyltransferase